MTTTIDTEEQALVRAVCAQPGDDLARLRYADWLEERGEIERSEFHWDENDYIISQVIERQLAEMYANDNKDNS